MFETKYSCDYMEEWKGLPLSQLKKLVKSRAGRIAELQVEIRVLEGIIEARAMSGDLGEEKKQETGKEKVEKKQDRPAEKEGMRPSSQAGQNPEQKTGPQTGTQPNPQFQQPAQRSQEQRGQQFTGQKPSVSRSLDAPQVYGSQENGDEQDKPGQKKKSINTFVEL
jgi:hypothetical protein